VDSDYLFGNCLQRPGFRSTDKANLIGESELIREKANFTTVLEKLSPTDFDLAYGLAKQMTGSSSAKEYFEM
jgi:hypothetical protein